MPQRIQLSRKKGFKLPANTVVVSRPSKWGNPFTVQHNGPDAVKLFRRQLDLWGEYFYREQPVTVGMIKAELRGKNLACWCELSDECHADTLLEIANED